MVLLELITALHGCLLRLLLLIEEFFDLVVISDQYLVSLFHERRFNLFQLMAVLSSKLMELGSHPHNQVFNISRLFL